MKRNEKPAFSEMAFLPINIWANRFFSLKAEQSARLFKDRKNDHENV